MYKILDIELNEMKENLKNRIGIKLNFSDSLKDVLVEKGYDSELGARPLKRTVNKLVLDEISEYLFGLEKIPAKLSIDWNKEEEKVSFK